MKFCFYNSTGHHLDFNSLFH